MNDDRFVSFFASVNGGRAPYPWQRELAADVARSGTWPAAISAPTGAGKSSVVDVHLFVVGEHAAGRTSARPPRRLVLVAPRRVLVDDQYERAAHLSAVLAELAGQDGTSVAHEVARSLAGLAPSGAEGQQQPLLATRLRGGAAIDDEWRLDPARCQVISATPQMWGSRLLLRGFRSSRRARNLESGLLARDVVAVIDEAHLHERLLETATRAAGLGAGSLALQVVGMSATRDVEGALRLGDADLDDPELRRRVTAAKTVDLDEIDHWPRDVVDRLVTGATEIALEGTIGVIVNTVERALLVARRLQLVGPTAVVCGRMRPADVAALRERHPGLLDPRGNAGVRYLVSTQSLEVGVDIDLAGLVTELAPASAIAQRAGRLNRSGRREGTLLRVVMPPAGTAIAEKDALPYAPDDLGAARSWLDALHGDASPLSIARSAMPTAARPAMPPLGRTELETVAMTSEPVGADVEVSFYVDEPRDREELSIGVAAREHMELSEVVVEASLLAAPPRQHELASFALVRRRGALEPGRALAIVLAEIAGHDRLPREVWVLRREAGTLRAFKVDPLQPDLRDGDSLVIPAGSHVMVGDVLGVPHGGGSGQPIADVMGARPASGRAPARPDAVIPLPGTAVAEALAEDATLSTRRARRLVADALEGSHPNADRRLRRDRLADVDVTWCEPADESHEPGLLVLADRSGSGRLARSSVADATVTVDDHQAAVVERLRLLLDRLAAEGLPERALLRAAAWHDEGKRHPSFQVRMGASRDAPPEAAVAKPLPGVVADRGEGWRHEQLSAAFAGARESEPLTTVLCAAHHGVGRPSFDRDADALLDGWSSPPTEVVREAHRLFGDCGAFERERDLTQREWGIHALAHLEALLRCADIQVSREGR